MTRSSLNSAGVMLFGVALALAAGWTLERRSAATTAPDEATAPAYRERELSFSNGEVRLAGTLALPDGPGPFPAVVLISGAGPQNRDGELFGHRRAVVKTAALVAAGIAVLRFDDRGVGESTGDLAQATLTDLAEDARQAVRLVRRQPEISPERVGLLGSSQGSVVAPLAAVEEPGVAFVVLLACLGRPMSHVWIDQNLDLALAAGLAEPSLGEFESLLRQALELLDDSAPEEAKRRQLRRIIHRLDTLAPAPLAGLSPTAGSIEMRVSLFFSPSFVDNLRHDPGPVLERLRIPVLALSGSLDLQTAPATNLPAIRAALEAAGNGDFEIEEVPGLNHFLQPATTGLPSEYGTSDVAYDPHVLERISTWIRRRFVEGALAR